MPTSDIYSSCNSLCFIYWNPLLCREITNICFFIPQVLIKYRYLCVCAHLRLLLWLYDYIKCKLPVSCFYIFQSIIFLWAAQRSWCHCAAMSLLIQLSLMLFTDCDTLVAVRRRKKKNRQRSRKKTRRMISTHLMRQAHKEMSAYCCPRLAIYLYLVDALMMPASGEA